MTLYISLPFSLSHTHTHTHFLWESLQTITNYSLICTHVLWGHALKHCVCVWWEESELAAIIFLNYTLIGPVEANGKWQRRVCVLQSMWMFVRATLSLPLCVCVSRWFHTLASFFPLSLMSTWQTLSLAPSLLCEMNSKAPWVVFSTFLCSRITCQSPEQTGH